MVDKRLAAALMSAALVAMVPHLATGQAIPEGAAILATPSSETFRAAPGTTLSLGLKKFVNSFTSYQFSNPFPPQQDPLSRLEFPIDQWFAGLLANHETATMSLGCQVWTNAGRWGSPQMQDSDWEDGEHPTQKTVFSESHCRLNQGLMAEAFAAVVPPIDLFFKVRPLVGLRYQRFYFTTYDGLQKALGDDPAPLDGDGIDFKQIFRHYFLGGQWKNAPLAALPGLSLDIRVDYGLVRGKNEDLHFVRDGHRVTTECTKGQCWHFRGGAGVAIPRLGLEVAAEVDFMRVVSDGSHNLNNPAFNIDFSFEGSRVWTDQLSLAFLGKIAM
jgi:hypothetical protein